MRVHLPLPVVDPPQERVSQSAGRGRSGFAGFPGYQILVAEDNRVNQLVIRRMLERLGPQVVIANDGREAVEAAKDGRFDLVLMDCQMPEMDGLAATRTLRQHWDAAALPILALTADADQQTYDACREVGMNDHLTKPLELDRLAAALAQWLPAAPATRERAS
jgi:CheY-like chemotaxis protein